MNDELLNNIDNKVLSYTDRAFRIYNRAWDFEGQYTTEFTNVKVMVEIAKMIQKEEKQLQKKRRMMIKQEEKRNGTKTRREKEERRLVVIVKMMILKFKKKRKKMMDIIAWMHL